MSEKTYILEWNSGLFGQVSFYFDFIALIMLTLLAFLAWTNVLSRQASSQKASIWNVTALFLGSLITIAANDGFSLMAGIAIISMALLALDSSAREDSNPGQASTLTMSVIGWTTLLGGVAFLVASAAIVRSAPHGLPGLTTSNLHELTELIRRSALQHPAAKLTWEQYQLVPTAALLIGVGVLSGIFPFHSLFARNIENGSLLTRLWMLMISKIAMLIFYRLSIASDLASWAAIAELLTLPALFGFVYASYLLYSSTNAETHLSRSIIWSQQFTLLCWVLLPQAAPTALWLNVIVQFSGLVLLCLVIELADHHAEDSLFIPKFIGILSVGGTSSLAGLLMVWDGSLELSTSPPLGAAGFVLFAIALLISVAGFLTFLQRSIAAGSVVSTSLNQRQKSLLACWSLVTILASFATIAV